MRDKTNQNTRFDYWFRAVKWFIINASFGVFPLVFMMFVNAASKGRVGHQQVDHLIYEGGIILFVAIAMMGAVMGDFLLSGFKSKGLLIFAIYIFPLLILGFVSTEFMLICTNNMEKETFSLTSITTIIVVFFSFIYCTLVKGGLFLIEDTENKKYITDENV